MSDHDHPIIHMVGSIPLGDAEAVFRTLGSRIGGHVERIPDGETGRRQRWISFINDQLKANAAFEIDTSIPPFPFTQYDGTVVYEIERLTFAEGATPRTMERYTRNTDGAIYGWAVSPGQVGPGRPANRTPIRGLLLAGHWTQPGGGIYGVVTSGVGAAREALGFTRDAELWKALAEA